MIDTIWIRTGLATLRAFAFMVAVAVSIVAQTRATSADLSGTIFDQSKAVVRDALVTARNTATGLERAAVTTSDGRYAIPALPPGSYMLTATLAGFVSERIEGVTLVLGQAAQVNFILRIAPTSETVTVQADTLPVSTGQAALASVVSQRQIDTLPTNGRNFLAFAMITPAVNSDRTPQKGTAATSGLTLMGQRARSNNITVDGLDNNEIMTGSVRATFSQEAIQEFQVIANSYPAEFGKAAGGIVNTVTKSGTNAISGNAFGFFRNDTLNARGHFETFNPAGERIDQGKAPYRQGQFGGTLGGPLRRNRSFFFFSAERLRIQTNNFVNIDNKKIVKVAGQSFGTLVDILRRENFPIELGNVPYRIEADQLLGKVDTKLKDRHQIALRVNWASQLDENAESWGGLIARSGGGSRDSRDLVTTASLTSVLSSHSVNELRFQAASRLHDMFPLDPKCDGKCDCEDEGGPSVEIGSVLVGRHGLLPQPHYRRLYQVVETFSHDVARHHFKAGLDASLIDQQLNSFPFDFGGQYVFMPLGTLSAEQAFALGWPAYSIQGYGTPLIKNKWYSDLSVFAQDDWRVSERLTLSLGVRYQSQFFPKIKESVPGLPTMYGWPPDRNNVAPRVGVSWNPDGEGRTRVSGAYGIFYDNLFTALWSVPYAINGASDHVRLRVVPYPQSIAAWQSPDRRITEPTDSPLGLVMTIDPNLKTPYAQHATIGLERLLRPGLMVSVHGVYVRGFNQVGIIEYNPVIPGSGRPLDEVGSIGQYTSWAESWYRGMTVSAQKRAGNRFDFMAAYTLSRAESMSDDFFGQPQDCGFGRNPADQTGLPLHFDPESERGLSLQDERHRFVLSGTYVFPGRIEVSGIVSIGSGRPYNIIAGSDLNGDFDTWQSDRPWRIKNDLSTRIGRNAGRLPGTSSVDLRVARRLSLGGGVVLDLMFEVFNLLNHTNYTQVDAVFGPGAYPNEPLPSFGQFTKAGPPFQAQLGVKISFLR